jgi:uncharacterized damage-inducible protein DinB
LIGARASPTVATMSDIIVSIAGEYRRTKSLADRAVAQVDDSAFHHVASPTSNSIAVLLQHLAGNLTSRFTEFLATDGEKPWRDRDVEFVPRGAPRAELLASWERAWAILFAQLDALTDGDLDRRVVIRGQELSVAAALHRSLAHAAYHVGQIVLLARDAAGDRWESLSIARGASAAYNAAPDRDRPPPAP